MNCVGVKHTTTGTQVSKQIFGHDYDYIFDVHVNPDAETSMNSTWSSKLLVFDVCFDKRTVAHDCGVNCEIWCTFTASFFIPTTSSIETAEGHTHRNVCHETMETVQNQPRPHLFKSKKERSACKANFRAASRGARRIQAKEMTLLKSRTLEKETDIFPVHCWDLAF